MKRVAEPDAPPLIAVVGHAAAISWGAWRDIPATFTSGTYLRNIEEAGGAPVTVPPAETYATRPEIVTDLADGLLLVGGDDIEPELYGAARDPRTGPSSELRDRTELALLGAAIRSDVPVLAICRGFQLLNVLQGGSLRQDLSDEVRVEVHRPTPGVFGRHRVRIEGGRLRELLGRTSDVLSHHHQGIDAVGADLAVTARASDGTIEGLELVDAGFCVGVLWHPEESADGTMAPLFGAFVEAARARSARRRPAVARA